MSLDASVSQETSVCTRWHVFSAFGGARTVLFRKTSRSATLVEEGEGGARDMVEGTPLNTWGTKELYQHLHGSVGKRDPKKREDGGGQRNEMKGGGVWHKTKRQEPQPGMNSSEKFPAAGTPKDGGTLIDFFF